MQGKQPDPQWVTLSVKFYQSLIRIYPSAFRSSYGELMLQAFRDSCRQASRIGNPAGLILFWSRTLVDVFLSVIEQYANRGAVMTESKWIKLSGWIMAASGVFFLTGWLASTRPPYHAANAASWPVDRYLNVADNPLLFLGILFIGIGILGLLVRFRRSAGRLGRAGLILSLIGTAAGLVGIVGISIQDSGPWWQMIMLGMTALFLGLGLFGIDCIRHKLLGRWNSLPLLISLPWLLLLSAELLLNTLMGDAFDVPPIFVAITFVISLCGLALVGYLLQSDGRESQPALA